MVPQNVKLTDAAFKTIEIQPYIIVARIKDAI
jgi:hypothetical protein